MSQHRILVASLILATGAGSAAPLGAQSESRSLQVPPPMERASDPFAAALFPPPMRPNEGQPWGPAITLSVAPELWRSLTLIGPPRLLTAPDRAGLRLVVSIRDRSLAALLRGDTVFRVPVSVASGLRLAYGGQAWRFQTPRGSRSVLRKTANPVWTPPDWHYAEVARDYGLHVAQLPPAGVVLRTGARLVVRHRMVGLIYPGRAWAALPIDEHIVFDGKLFIPPVGTANRRVHGELGDFALDLGGGYMIHGTWDDASVGRVSTHGCIRVRDDDLVWLFENIPVGAVVQIH